LTPEALIAPLVIDGLMNSLGLKSCITNILAKEVRPGDLLIFGSLFGSQAVSIQKVLNRAGIS
jgi:hypothetical protein